jgi:tetratricopeptide (TPR) repeat protein
VAALNQNPFVNEANLRLRGVGRLAAACVLAVLFLVGGCESTPEAQDRKTQPAQVSRTPEVSGNPEVGKKPGKVGRAPEKNSPAGSKVTGRNVADSAAELKAAELKKAKKLILAKAWREAEDCLVRLVVSDGSNAEVFFWFGFVVYAQGRVASAIDCFSKAIALEPGFAEAYNNRGIAWKKRGDSKRAISDFTEAARLKPGYAAPLVSRGQVWYGKGDSEKAIADYSEAIRLDPESIDAFYHRGIARTALGGLKEAIADFEKCLTLRPSDEAGKSIRQRITELEAWID